MREGEKLVEQNKTTPSIASRQDMTAKEFLQKLKQHCTGFYDKHSCRECRVFEFCYSTPKSYTDELLSESIAYFS